MTDDRTAVEKRVQVVEEELAKLQSDMKALTSRIQQLELPVVDDSQRYGG